MSTTTISTESTMDSTTTAIPTLDELINYNHHSSTTTPTTYPLHNYDYTKELHNFNLYLKSIHCHENLQFIIQLNKYLQLFASSDHKPHLSHWQNLYIKYLNCDSDLEINLPSFYKNQLSFDQLPQLSLLYKCKKYIYDEILLNLYNEFLKYQQSSSKSSSSTGSTSESQQQLPYSYHRRRHSEQQTTIPKYTTQRPTFLNHSKSLSYRNLDTQDKEDNYCPKTQLSTPPLSPPSQISPLPIASDTPQTINHKHHNNNRITSSGYDYYTIPSTISSSSSNSNSSSLTSLESSPRTTRNNSTGSNNNTSRGSSISSIILDSSFNYLNKVKKIKFRRFSHEQ